ncbi:MAG TPA: hypothetical protein VHM92_11455 [Allosphingosinicella sp.]|nr:hypothetical protein [Allosphingosinicella sp.]
MGLRHAWIAALLLMVPAALAAHPPYSLVVDPAGNAYFSDLEAVWKLAPDGRLSLFRPAVAGKHVHELAAANGAIEGEQNEYDPATQTHRGAIWRRTLDGRETWVLAPTTTAPKGMGVPRDRAGNRYVAHWVDSRDRRTMLFRRSTDGRVALLYGPADEAARFSEALASSVGGMVFPADGSAILADGRALRRADAAGRVATIYEGPKEAALRGLALASDGRILAADSGRRAVFAVSLSGESDQVYASPPGWIATAAAQVRGKLLVLEANADPYDYVRRMRVVEAVSGGRRVVAEPWKGATKPTVKMEDRRRRGAAGLALPAAAAAIAAAAAVLAMARRRRAG